MRLLVFVLLNLYCLSLFSQKLYFTSGGEVIFQSALIKNSKDNLNTKVRFTAAFHLGEFLNADIGKHIGFLSGIGLRNIGFITDENDVKIKYRSYNIGIPLALKLGSLKKDIYFFGGAEYEWMVHFKQKTFREGGKYKTSSWFSNRTPAFIPSAFIGLQFPNGVQMKFRYYLDDFLNHNFKGDDIYNDYTNFTKTQIWYISMSYIIKHKKKESTSDDKTEIAFL